jgi:hypothetical protein
MGIWKESYESAKADAKATIVLKRYTTSMADLLLDYMDLSLLTKEEAKSARKAYESVRRGITPKTDEAIKELNELGNIIYIKKIQRCDSLLPSERIKALQRIESEQKEKANRFKRSTAECINMLDDMGLRSEELNVARRMNTKMQTIMSRAVKERVGKIDAAIGDTKRRLKKAERAERKAVKNEGRSATPAEYQWTDMAFKGLPKSVGALQEALEVHEKELEEAEKRVHTAWSELDAITSDLREIEEYRRILAPLARENKMSIQDYVKGKLLRMPEKEIPGELKEIVKGIKQRQNIINDCTSLRQSKSKDVELLKSLLEKQKAIIEEPGRIVRTYQAKRGERVKMPMDWYKKARAKRL